MEPGQEGVRYGRRKYSRLCREAEAWLPHGYVERRGSQMGLVVNEMGKTVGSLWKTRRVKGSITAVTRKARVAQISPRKLLGGLGYL